MYDVRNRNLFVLLYLVLMVVLCVNKSLHTTPLTKDTFERYDSNQQVKELT